MSQLLRGRISVGSRYSMRVDYYGGDSESLCTINIYLGLGLACVGRTLEF